MKTAVAAVLLLGLAFLLAPGAEASTRKLHIDAVVETNVVLPESSGPKCCDDLPLFTSVKSDAAVCAAAEFEDGCADEMKWDEAKDYCEGMGARLCTYEEFKGDVLKGLPGCDVDDDKVWSSEPCTIWESGDNGYLVLEGDKGKGQKCYSKHTEKAKVACCATACGAPKCCDELVDSYGFKFSKKGDGSVCASADVAGLGCVLDLSWETAKATCEGIGARLCTFDDLKDQNLLSIGCSLNKELTWTSERCTIWESGDNGYIVAETDGGRDAVCMSKHTGQAALACCGDVC